MPREHVALYDRFATQARRYGVELAEASPGEVADAIEPRAIGTPLPWDDVELPDGVVTNPTPADVERAVTGVTAASLAVADYGSVVLGMDSAAFNGLCTGCSRCVEARPAGIDIPWINTVVRDRINGANDPDLSFLVDGLTPEAETSGPGLQEQLFGDFELLAKLGSAFALLSNWVANAGPVSRGFEAAAGVAHDRDLPEFQRTMYVEWFADRDRVPPIDPDRKLVLYPDLYTNYMMVERGKAAVRALEALGVEVLVPSVPGAGRASLSQGMIDTARHRAERVTEPLDPYVEAGYDVVVVEPSDLAMFRGDYERLLSATSAEPLAEHCYEVLEYVDGLLANGADADALNVADGETVAYHSHCQQRTMGLEEYSTAVLDTCGYEVTTSDVECCGMAGSFGYKEQYYELAMDVGSNLETQLRDADCDHVIASGTSCTDQIGDLLGEEPTHVIELIAPGEENS